MERRAALAALVLAFSCANGALAQEKARWQIGVSGAAGVPQGELAQRLPDTRWGGFGYFTHRFHDSPFRFGVELGLFNNGGIDIPLVWKDRGGDEEGLLGNGVYFARFLLRLQPVHGRWSPFVEGAVGAQGFETSIVLKDCSSYDCNVSTISTSTTVSLGGGGGLAFRLTKDEARESGFSLETGVRYLFGGTAKYYLPSDLPELAEGGAPPRQRSRTSLLTISFGVVFDF